MSKICIFVLKPNTVFADRTILSNSIHNLGYSVFFDFNYTEPVAEHYKNSAFIFSLADDGYYDNCEKLLLPDNCVINDFKNEIPFIKRMQDLACLINTVLDKSSSLELFIGESGTDYNDFDSYSTNVNSFPYLANRLLNNISFNSIRFIFVNEEWGRFPVLT